MGAFQFDSAGVARTHLIPRGFWERVGCGPDAAKLSKSSMNASLKTAMGIVRLGGESPLCWIVGRPRSRKQEKSERRTVRR